MDDKLKKIELVEKDIKLEKPTDKVGSTISDKKDSLTDQIITTKTTTIGTFDETITESLEEKIKETIIDSKQSIVDIPEFESDSEKTIKDVTIISDKKVDNKFISPTTEKHLSEKPKSESTEIPSSEDESETINVKAKSDKIYDKITSDKSDIKSEIKDKTTDIVPTTKSPEKDIKHVTKTEGEGKVTMDDKLKKIELVEKDIKLEKPTDKVGSTESDKKDSLTDQIITTKTITIGTFDETITESHVENIKETIIDSKQFIVDIPKSEIDSEKTIQDVTVISDKKVDDKLISPSTEKHLSEKPKSESTEIPSSEDDSDTINIKEKSDKIYDKITSDKSDIKSEIKDKTTDNVPTTKSPEKDIKHVTKTEGEGKVTMDDKLKKIELVEKDIKLEKPTDKVGSTISDKKDSLTDQIITTKTTTIGTFDETITESLEEKIKETIIDSKQSIVDIPEFESDSEKTIKDVTIISDKKVDNKFISPTTEKHLSEKPKSESTEIPSSEDESETINVKAKSDKIYDKITSDKSDIKSEIKDKTTDIVPTTKSPEKDIKHVTKTEGEGKVTMDDKLKKIELVEKDIKLEKPTDKVGSTESDKKDSLTDQIITTKTITIGTFDETITESHVENIKETIIDSKQFIVDIPKSEIDSEKTIQDVTVISDKKVDDKLISPSTEKHLSEKPKSESTEIPSSEDDSDTINIKEKSDKIYDKIT
ncbi:titin homolog, partial [Sipha flava]|uniref:Titin homolog n=1 Tax=Sipha flava TaxID=143950 RepID=A0A8B8F3X9_9HEMI